MPVTTERRTGKQRRAKVKAVLQEKRSGAERRQADGRAKGAKLKPRLLLIAPDEDLLIVRLAKKENRKINSLIRELLLAGLQATKRI